jgi:hypothetical protein
MNNKQMAFAAVWNKYLPAIRILLKKAATTEQLLGVNRDDFERAAGIRKSGYRFTVNFIDGRTDAFFNGNDIVQAFISVLVEDAATHVRLAENDYTFSFNSKYQLQIKHINLQNQVLLPAPPEEILPG